MLINSSFFTGTESWEQLLEIESERCWLVKKKDERKEE